MAFQIGINGMKTDVPADSSGMTEYTSAFDSYGDDENTCDMIWTATEGLDVSAMEISTMDISAMDVSIMEITTYTIMDMSVDDGIEETAEVDDPPIVRLYASKDSSARHDLTVEIAIQPEIEIEVCAKKKKNNA